ncbi:MAG: beta-galactosidase, partial [Planctomycetota bacterium]
MKTRDDILARGRVVAIEPTFYDFAGEGVKAEEIVRHARAMRANTIRFGAFSHQGTAYYASDIAPRARGLEERDFLAELMEACRRAKLHLVVYVNSGFDPIMGKKHPEWVRRDARGRKVGQGWLANMCNSSPYLDYFLSIADEIAGKYRPECLYVDNFMGGLLCRCEGCRAAYQKATGGEIPKAADFDSRAFRRYLAWHYGHQRALWRRVASRVRRALPGTLLVFNRGTYLHGCVRRVGCRQEEMIEDADALHYECATRGLNEDLASYINQTAKFGRAVGGRPWMWV